MSAGWQGQALREPISADKPCGENLEDTPILASFDSLRLFGNQAESPEAPPELEDREKETRKPRPPLEWDQIRTNALDALGKSKDLRLLAYLAAALLRTDGLPAFADVLGTASYWLDSYWDQLYPPIDEDAIARRNALNCFADRMAVVDRVWRMPLVVSRQHGKLSLRDVDMARGQVPVGPMNTKPHEDAIGEAFREMALEELTLLDASASGSLSALQNIDAKMRGVGGPDVAPDFGPLSTQFAKLNRLCRDQLAIRTGSSAPAAEAASAEGEGAYAGGAVKSRQDAIRALEAVANFFRGSEPSSPVPMIVDRAKRLVSKDFLEVLADIAPEALSTARSAGGLKDQ